MHDTLRSILKVVRIECEFQTDFLEALPYG